MSRANYIFVDFESVQEIHLELIAGKPVKVFLFFGPQQHKVPVELMTQAHRFHEQVELVQVECAGKNALDFVLAHHTGRQAAADPQGYFHLLSKDKGFDALIRHLKSRGIQAGRAEVFARIPILMDLQTLPITDRLERMKTRLEKMKGPERDGRPKRVKGLCSTIHNAFHQLLSEDDVKDVLNGLKQKQWIGISGDDKVAYQF